jgi:crotonobetainyl-CoA:carnitine CoA-transferase CaiB-like acyl-CoA transferase
VIQAEAGFMGMNGFADMPPVKLPVALMDLLAAAQLKEAVLLGLLRRERTGQGATITVSLLQAAVAALANQASNYLVAGHVPTRAGSDHPNIAPYGTPFLTADGQWVVLAVGTDRQFRQLCEVLDLDHFSGAPSFATNQKRIHNRPFLHALLEESISRWNRDELLAELHARDVPAGAVRSLDEVFSQPTAAELVLQDEDSGTAAVRTVAFEMDGVARIDLAPPPGLGSGGPHGLLHQAAPETAGN